MARLMDRCHLVVSLWLLAVALDVALYGFLFLLPTEQGGHGMTEKLAAGLSPVLAFPVSSLKKLWWQANGDLDSFAHTGFPS
jgi:hypothetical protein